MARPALLHDRSARARGPSQAEVRRARAPGCRPRARMPPAAACLCSAGTALETCMRTSSRGRRRAFRSNQKRGIRSEGGRQATAWQARLQEHLPANAQMPPWIACASGRRHKPRVLGSDAPWAAAPRMPGCTARPLPQCCARGRRGRGHAPRPCYKRGRRGHPARRHYADCEQSSCHLRVSPLAMRPSSRPLPRRQLRGLELVRTARVRRPPH